MTLTPLQIDVLTIYLVIAGLSLLLTAGSNARPRNALLLVVAIAFGLLALLFLPPYIAAALDVLVPLESS